MRYMPGSEIIGKEEREAVNRVFDNGGILYRYACDESKGEVSQVRVFEKLLSDKIGVDYCHAVSSGTAALKTALIGMGIQPGDEVITQSHTFVATVEAIIEVGAIPIITEINETLNMDPDDLISRITNKTRAIIPVHMAGVPAQMDEICKIARSYDLLILEDAAQAFGAQYKGKQIGSIGDVGIFSFDYGKMLTTGEGGLIATNNKAIYHRAREYSDHGHEMNPLYPRGKDTRTRGGFNYRMMEIQAAIGIAQLNKLDMAIERQQENKKILIKGISSIPNIQLRRVPDGSGEIADTLIFSLADSMKAKRFAESLNENGIYTKNLPDAIKWHFSGTWDHMLPQFAIYNGEDLSTLWPISKDILERSIAIPIKIKMTENEIHYIVDCINGIAKLI